MTAGVTTPNLTPVALADSLIVNRGGSTYLQTLAALGAQLASTGPLAVALLAQAARIDQIEIDGDVYSTTGAGLADTVVGAQFRVRSSDPDVAYRIYRHDAGPVATLILAAPSVAALEEKAGAADLEAEIAARETLASYVGDRLDDGVSSLSGYEFGLVDAAGRIALGVTVDGAVEMPGTPKFEALDHRPAALSGVEWGVVDQDGRLAFGITPAGNVLAKGEEIDLGGFAATVNDLGGQLYPAETIDCWGDSMTHGNTSGVTTPYPAALAALLPARTVNNKGLSGRTSLQIATAFGAVPSILTVAGNTIPASGGVRVTLTEAGNFSSKANFGTINTLGTLFGIEGNLAVQFNSDDPNLPGVTTFTRLINGTAVAIPNRTPFHPRTNGWEGNTVVIWSGRNDIISGFDNDTILSNIEAMVDFQSALRPRFVILTVTDQGSEPSGSANHTQILALNHEIMRRWPRNAIDIRKILVNAYDPGAPADVTAFGQDRVPPSLQSDGLHLNNAGYAIVAQAVANFLTMKGW